MDAWNSQTLGDIFPGAGDGLAALFNEANTIKNKANRALMEQLSKLAVLEASISRSGSLLSQLSVAGFYSLDLEPGRGGWLSRAQGASGDKPPNRGYSAGSIIVVTGADLGAITSQYSSLRSILTTPFS